jgi:hypothetical protein
MTLSLSDCGFYPMLCVWLRSRPPKLSTCAMLQLWASPHAMCTCCELCSPLSNSSGACTRRGSWPFGLPLCASGSPRTGSPRMIPAPATDAAPPQRACCDNLIPQNQIPQNARGSLAILCVFVPGLGSPRMIPAPPRLPPLRACCDNLIPQNQIPQNALHRAAPNPQVSDPPEL